jgi:hypothetical protein
VDQIGGQHSQAVFAADGKARHRLVRAAVAAGVALLAAWLIALALGVLGGFGSLPGLPARSSQSNSTGTQVDRAPRGQPGAVQAPHQSARRPAVLSVRTATPPPESRVPDTSRATSPAPKPTSQAPVSTSAPVATPSPSTNGRRLGTTKSTTTGKPAGSPGNGAGGSGAPGRLR